jgi:hypothetical protein
MSGIFNRNIVLMLVSIAVIPIMASLNAPSLSTKIGSILRGGVSESLALITDEPLVGIDVKALMV